jgi:hypothetical protein
MILDGSNGVTFNDASLQGAAASPYVLKNRIINGAMVIDQRNAGASITANNNVFAVDRFKFQATQSSKGTLQQSTTAPTGFINSLLFTSSSAYSITSTDFFVHTQNIEGYNILDLAWGTANASTVTLSFWVRSSLTGTFGGVIQNNAQDYNYPFSFTISAANTWEKKNITIVGPTSGTWLTTNGRGINLLFGLGVGATYSGTAGTWTTSNVFSVTGATSVVGTSGATFYITGVQLEIGSTATPFERRLYGQELANCQRYYFKVAPGNGGYLTETAFAISTTGAYGANKFPVTMRTAPASLEQSGTAGDYRIVRCGAAGSTTCSSVPTFATATVDRAFTSFAVSSGLSNSSAGAMDAAGANAFLAWSAEL